MPGMPSPAPPGIMLPPKPYVADADAASRRQPPR